MVHKLRVQVSSALAATWKMITTTAPHAIPPFILYNFWKACCVHSRCAAALLKMINCQCSGTAAVYALAAGVEQCGHLIIHSGFTTSEALRAQDVVDNMAREQSEDGWCGSVNAALLAVR